jgi:NitT/TauT family transport system substrate-binding protein
MRVHFRRSVTRGGLSVLAVVGALVLASCSSSSSGGSSSGAGEMTLRIAYNPNATNTSIVVADQQGFFKKNGLTVKLTATQASAALMPSIGKQFELITVTPPTLLQNAAQGFKPTLVAAEDVENATDLRNSFLVGDKSITSVSALKGKTIAVPTLSGNLYEGAVVMLNKAGIKKNQVKFLQVPFTDMASDLKSGTIQAAVTIFPFQGQLFGQGYKDLGNPTVDAAGGGTAMSAGWAAYQPWAKSHKKALDAFNKSQDEALAWMKANPAGARQVLVKEFHLPAQVANTFPVTQWVSFEPKEEYLSAWVQPMKDVGDLPSTFNTPMSQLVYASES